MIIVTDVCGSCDDYSDGCGGCDDECCAGKLLALHELKRYF